MAFDRFLIAPMNSGLQNNLRPWLIADDAWQQLNNAYLFRGRVRKRFGGRFMGTGWPSPALEPLYSRFRILLGMTDGGGGFSGTAPGGIFQIGQMFSIGTEIYTVWQTGTPAAMLDTGATATATFNTTTGAYIFVGAPATTNVYYYTALPVMGLCNYEYGPINDQPSFGFDTQFAYVFSGGSWNLSTGGVTPQWHGDNTNFFWATNWDGVTDDAVVLFVTNFQAAIGAPAPLTDDPIWTWDGTDWSSFTPAFDVAGDFIVTSRIIVAFKNRLLLLNTIEQNADNTLNSSYVNRCRFSWNGSPLATTAFYEPNQVGSGGGGFVDATTEEAIVSAEFIKDRLIVYFERSTWELAYTGNNQLPFVWQKLNTELGSESQFSTVPFDKAILTIGNTGVHACNGSNVERIDTLIPDEVFDIVDKEEGVARVAGIRDYFVEMVYWTFPSTNQNVNEVYPSRVLVYNYRTNTWAFNDDCITAFGYFEQQTGTTWASTTDIWEEANFTWESGTTAAQFRQVIAGNQEGFVFIVDADHGRNAAAMQLTNLVYSSGQSSTATIIDHTLKPGDYVMIEFSNGITSVNGNIYQVNSYVDTNTVTLNTGPLVGTYKGGGFVTRVSNIQLQSKQWNPYDSKGRNVYLARIDFAVQPTANGQITVDYYPSSSEVSLINGGTDSGAIMGTGVLETYPYNPAYYPLEQFQTRLWHPIYFQSDGECIQLNMSFSDAQITNPDIAFSDFELEGLVLHTQPTSARLQ